MSKRLKKGTNFFIYFCAQKTAMTCENKLEKFVKQNHRGISGIIVSLILIAVAVVGGIAVFTFTQGFISDTQVTAPSIDVIEIFGYDASDSINLISHTGAIVPINSKEKDSLLVNADAFSLYIRNRGSGPVVINSIEVYGTPYTISNTVPCTTAVPLITEFTISSDGALANCGQAFIASGEEVTVYVRYATSTNGDVALGRPIPVTVVTANGMESTKQLTNGAQAG